MYLLLLGLLLFDVERDVREVVSRYVNAREQRDPAAAAALFTADADQLVSSGEWRKGRDALVKGAMASSQTSTGKRTIEIESVRFLAPTVAIRGWTLRY